MKSNIFSDLKFAGRDARNLQTDALRPALAQLIRKCSGKIPLLNLFLYFQNFSSRSLSRFSFLSVFSYIFYTYFRRRQLDRHYKSAFSIRIPPTYLPLRIRPVHKWNAALRDNLSYTHTRHYYIFIISCMIYIYIFFFFIFTFIYIL